MGTAYRRSDDTTLTSEFQGAPYRIRNIGALFIGVVAVLLFSSMAIFLYAYYARAGLPLLHGVSIPVQWILYAAAILDAVIVARLRALWEGIVFDFKNRMMRFPGGGITPNNFIDIFKPTFLLQYFLRFNIPVSEIRMIKTRETHRINRVNGRQIRETRFYLDFNGKFGALHVEMSEEKRDEVYSFVREFNRMGNPIVKG